MVLIGLAIYFLVLSNARFFIAATTLSSARVGVRLVDYLNISVTSPDGSNVWVDFRQMIDWRSDLVLLAVVAFLFYLDHKRRPKM